MVRPTTGMTGKIWRPHRAATPRLRSENLIHEKSRNPDSEMRL